MRAAPLLGDGRRRWCSPATPSPTTRGCAPWPRARGRRRSDRVRRLRARRRPRGAVGDGRLRRVPDARGGVRHAGARGARARRAGRRSDLPVLREVGGGLPRYFDPYDAGGRRARDRGGDRATRRRAGPRGRRASRGRPRREGTWQRHTTGRCDRDPRRPQPRLPRARRDRRHGDRRARADPAPRRASRPAPHRRSSTARRPGRFDGASRRSSSRSTPTNRVEWVRGEQQLLPRLAARARLRHRALARLSTAPLWGRVPARDDDPRPQLQASSPRRTSACAALGMRVLVPAAARRSHRIIVDAASTRDDLVEHLASTPTKIDVVPLGVAPRRRGADAAGRAARAARARRRPVLLASAPSARTRTCARLLEALRAARTSGPCSSCPATATPHEAELRERADALGVDVRLPGWVPADDLEGLYALAAACRRSRRCTRASACRCSRRWRAACRSPARTARRCRRSRATPRCCSTRSDRGAIAARDRALLADAARRAPARRAAARGPRDVHLGARPRELTVASLRARAR